MPRLRQNEREQAVGMLLAGMTQTQIANHFNVSRMTIYRLMVRLRDTGNTSDRPRSGRPRVTTLRQDRYIRFIHLRNRFVTAVHTARLTLVEPMSEFLTRQCGTDCISVAFVHDVL
jgi:transposase